MFCFGVGVSMFLVVAPQNQLQRKVQRITNSDTQSKLEGTVQAKQKNM
jgi:phosphoribosylaminoimidazole (AIR) synthetase